MKAELWAGFASLLKGVLYQRVADEEWRPVWGPLSGFAGGAIVYALLALVPAYLVWAAVRRVRLGQREFQPAVWWGAAGWPLAALTLVPHLYRILSSTYFLALAVTSVVLIPWVIFGVWRVVPLYLKKTPAPA
jgi:hypothetical protein